LPVYHFKDYFIYYLLTSNRTDSEVVKNSIDNHLLTQIENYDRDNNTNNLDVLYTFLICDRKATEAGNKLHLHRNTVLYRIEKITEIFNLDLDNYNTRLELLLVYKVLDLVKAEIIPYVD